MENILNKLKTVEKNLSEERGRFVLFGMFLKEDSKSKWDIVISANWIGSETRKFLQYFVSKFASEVQKQDLANISSVVILNPTDPFVQTINQIIKTEHSDTRFTNCNFNNVEIKDAYIITSQRLNNDRKDRKNIKKQIK